MPDPGRESGETPQARKPGRPRSERARTAVLEAAAELLFSEGYAAITMTRIAERSGVSKATIYKWWSSKGAVVVDAFLASVQPHVPAPETGDTHEELAQPARAQLLLFRDSPIGAGLASIVAAAQSDPDVAHALRERWITPRRIAARPAVQRGKDRGDIHPEADDDLILDLIIGPIYYRLLTGYAPLDDDLVDRVVAIALHGVTHAAHRPAK